MSNCDQKCINCCRIHRALVCHQNYFCELDISVRETVVTGPTRNLDSTHSCCSCRAPSFVVFVNPLSRRQVVVIELDLFGRQHFAFRRLSTIHSILKQTVDRPPNPPSPNVGGLFSFTRCPRHATNVSTGTPSRIAQPVFQRPRRGFSEHVENLPCPSRCRIVLHRESSHELLT